MYLDWTDFKHRFNIADCLSTTHYTHGEMAYVSRTKKAQAQAKVASPVESPVKQTTNEVHVSATTSLETLETIREDLAEIKNDLKKTVTEDKLETLVSTIIKKLLQQNNKEREKLINAEVEKRCKQIEEKYDKKLEMMSRNIEILEKKTDSLTQKLHECKTGIRNQEQSLAEIQEASVEALRRSNKNEQYSRKYNFKIMGLKETQKENTWEKVKTFIKENAGVVIEDREIIAAHRIPGEQGKSRPILVKLVNTDVKSKVMRKRSEVKNKGYRLVDDVTKANVELIKRLSQLDAVQSAWYFNGAVYGKIGDRRMKFDITDDIEKKVKKAAK